MSKLQELMAQTADGGLDELSQRAMAFYREQLASQLEPDMEGRGLAIHPDSGDYLVADTPTHAGHIMRQRHPEGRFVTLRIGLKPDHALLARMNGIPPKV